MQLAEAPVIRAGMLIRRPAPEVFEVLVDPAITTKFWFSRGTAKLEPGRQVQWHWDMYGVSVTVDVKEVDPDERILIEWGGEGELSTTVEWTFDDRGDGTTYVTVANSGFSGSGEKFVPGPVIRPRDSPSSWPASRRSWSTVSI